MGKNYFGDYPTPYEAEKETQDTNSRKRGQTRQKIYVRYDEGAEMYSMCKHTFMKLAADARAVYKINHLSLVNIKIFEEYLETFRV